VRFTIFSSGFLQGAGRLGQRQAHAVQRASDRAYGCFFLGGCQGWPAEGVARMEKGREEVSRVDCGCRGRRALIPRISYASEMVNSSRYNVHRLGSSLHAVEGTDGVRQGVAGMRLRRPWAGGARVSVAPPAVARGRWAVCRHAGRARGR